MQPDNKENFDAVETVLAVRPNRNFSEGDGYSIGIPDWERAIEQHRNYCSALAACDVNVIVAGSESSFADSYKINSAAVITDAFAIIGRFPDGSSRDKETKTIVNILAGKKFLKFISAPGYLDASDVLRLGNHFYITMTDFTNEEGAAQLAFFLTESGYQATILDNISEGITINNMAVYLGKNRVLIDERIEKNYAFMGYKKITVYNDEKGATNSLMVNGTLIMPEGYSKTVQMVKAERITVIEANISEMEKMGAGIKSLALALPGNKKLSDIPIPNQLLQMKVA